MRVWRYEDEEGLGPYHSSKRDYSEPLEKMFNQHCWGKKSGKSHPGWGEDFRVRMAGKFVSGCTSKAQIGNWFRGYKDVLLAEGFTLVEYEVPKEFVKVGYSGKQCRFRIDKAQRITPIPLLAYS